MALANAMNAFVIVATSSILCAAAWIAPHYFGWLMLCYAVPLILYWRQEGDVSAWALFFGTLPLWFIHSYAIGDFCLKEYGLYGALFFLFFMVYMSSIRVCAIKAITHITTLVIGRFVILSFVIAEMVFWYIIAYHSFFIFGNDTGYCCAHPALPLVHTCFMHYLIVYGGVTASVCILMSNWVFALTLKKNRVLALVVCTGVFYIANKTIDSDLLNKSSCVYIIPPKEKYIFDWVAEVTGQLTTLHQERYDHVRTIILPESAFPFDQKCIPQVIETLNQTDVLDNKLFVCGCYRNNNENNKINSLFCVNKPRIIIYYDKSTLFPFVEFLPWKWLLSVPGEYKFGKNIECRSDCCRQGRLKDTAFFICSDIFFDTDLLHESLNLHNKKVIFISNDSWCRKNYFKELMSRYAWLFAITHQAELCYVSHSCGYEYALLTQKQMELLY